MVLHFVETLLSTSWRQARASAMISATIPSIRLMLFFLDGFVIRRIRLDRRVSRHPPQHRVAAGPQATREHVELHRELRRIWDKSPSAQIPR
jgi:hypothetical protein